MCEIYTRADPILYESRTRSVRMHGVLTTIRVENLFWDVLTEMAACEGVTTNQLVARLHDEVVERRGESESVNFASFLRVCCLRYLSSIAQKGPGASTGQARPAGTTTALRSVGS